MNRAFEDAVAELIINVQNASDRNRGIHLNIRDERLAGDSKHKVRELYNALEVSFRDQCAIAILSTCYRVKDNDTKQEIASHAFDLADAMNAERNKRNAKA